MQPARPRALPLLSGLLGVGVCLIALDAVPSFARPAAVEPPLEFQLEIGEEHLPVILDEAFTATIGGRAVRMRLTVAADRLFDNAGGLRFRYPKEMIFEFESLRPTVDSWVLTGNDCKLMLFRYRDSGVDADSLQEIFLGELVSRLGRDNVRIADGQLVLAGRTLGGRRVVATVGQETIHQDLFTIEHGTDAFVLVVQDNPTESGEQSEEARRTLALLRRTFEFPR